jgi:phage shock protein PspC (stress-responsive transcriptional regulator)
VNLSAVSGVFPIEMAENDTKSCPDCAEPVRVTATVCPHCRRRLGASPAPDAYRNHPGRQIAGVSIALAEAFGISVSFVRLTFVVLSFISFIGPPVYLALWLLLPAEPDGLSPLGRAVTGDHGTPSILERGIEKIEILFGRVAAWLRGETPPASAGATATSNPTQGEDTPAEGAP